MRTPPVGRIESRLCSKGAGRSRRREGETWIRAVAALGIGIASTLAAGALPGESAGSATVAFESYGTVFSRETRQSIAIDPHVFIKAVGGSSSVGPEGIVHAAGLAPAPLEDPPNSQLYAADRRPLQITLGQWTAARGTATIVPLGSGVRITTDFRNLIAQGSYSLFRVSRNGNRSNAAPLDGTGTTNNLVAAPDGRGSLTVTAGALDRGQYVVLLYHSDGAPHAMSQGVPGLTAHYQLVGRQR